MRLEKKYDYESSKIIGDKDVMKEIKKGIVGLDSSIFFDAKNKELMALEFEIHKVDLVETNVKCFKCGCKKIFYVIVQTRGADEAMSTINMCSKCKNIWKN